jgi:hypothetical protein
MAWTEQQLQFVAARRRLTRPTWYSAESLATTPITEEMEAALILLPSTVKQQTAQYLDLLINSSPPKTDHDAVVKEAADQWMVNQQAALADLDPTVQTFEALKDGLQGGDAATTQYIDGMAPMFQSLSRGFGKIEARLADLRFFNVVAKFAEQFYAGGATDEFQRELQSWKIVLLSYQ